MPTSVLEIFNFFAVPLTRVLQEDVEFFLPFRDY